MKNKIGSVLLSSLIVAACPGCSQQNQESNSEILEPKTKIGYQLENPEVGEEIALITTNLGEFKVRFFPEAAPKAVENFKGLASKGYYNGITFHRIIEDFMIQGGDPTATGTGGESLWGKDFEDEFSENLFNITGSLSMANRGPNTNGSQFFINYQDPKKFSGWSYFEKSYESYKNNSSLINNRYGGTIDMSKITEEVKQLYIDNGGNPHLDGFYNTAGRGHTVFGQVFDGLDTINKISKVETDQNDKPIEEVRIEKIELVSYQV